MTEQQATLIIDLLERILHVLSHTVGRTLP